MKRRFFLHWSVAGLAAGAAPRVMGKAWLPDFSSIEIEATGLTAAQWQLVSAVQDHLFPTEKEAPGAREANATAYLQWVLSDPDLEPRTREFFARGATALMLLLEQQGKGGFAALSLEEKEEVLRRFEQQEEGGEWLRELLNHILEALLTDPVYGGNLQGAGWRWIAHRPGFKRPPPDKRYFLL